MTLALIYTKYGILPFRKALGKYTQTALLNEYATHHTSRPLLRRVTLILLSGTIHGEATRAVLSNSEDRGHVPTPVAVVWRGPHGCQCLVEHIFITLLHELMRASNERERVDVVKLRVYLRRNKHRKRIRAARTSRVMLPPKSHPAPRGLTAQFSTSSGSDHMRSNTKGPSTLHRSRRLRVDFTHRKMHPRAGFPEPSTERESGRGCVCLARALHEHKAPRRRLSVRIMNENQWGV